MELFFPLSYLDMLYCFYSNVPEILPHSHFSVYHKNMILFLSLSFLTFFFAQVERSVRKPVCMQIRAFTYGGVESEQSGLYTLFTTRGEQEGTLPSSSRSVFVLQINHFVTSDNLLGTLLLSLVGVVVVNGQMEICQAVATVQDDKTKLHPALI